SAALRTISAMGPYFSGSSICVVRTEPSVVTTMLPSMTAEDSRSLTELACATTATKAKMAANITFFMRAFLQCVEVAWRRSLPRSVTRSPWSARGWRHLSEPSMSAKRGGSHHVGCRRMPAKNADAPRTRLAPSKPLLPIPTRIEEFKHTMSGVAMSSPAKHVPASAPQTETTPLRFVTAASLFDGHDAAINIMRRIIQSQGAEVIHLGHNRSVEDVVRAALQEDADAIAMSSYQGGHVEYFKYMVDMLKEKGASHIRVFGGGGGT